MVLSALTLHELAHIVAVKYLGGQVEKIKPFPLGLSARFRGLEKLLPRERYVIYGAGSIANAVAAAWAYSVSRISYVGVPLLEEWAFFNVVLCAFNLVPILPLDGGRIFHQFLSNRIGILRANGFVTKLGFVVGIGLIILGLVQMILYNYNLTLLCAGVYIKRKNKHMKPQLQMEFFRAMAGKKFRLLPVRPVKISADAFLKHAMGRLTADHMTEFFIEKECQSISETALLEYVFANGLRGTVSDLLTGQRL
ncbi:MAG: site-2 protease family protein [Firmicutes bacterium]|nr:site-2 protease family protein [Bacillota bacterium]